MIQAVQTAQTAAKPAAPQSEATTKTVKDTFLSMVSEKLGELQGIEGTIPQIADEDMTPNPADHSVTAALQELIAQLTQNPILILPQQNETADENAAVIPILTETVSVFTEQQAMLQEMQLMAEMAKQTVETVAIEDLVLPTQTGQLQNPMTAVLGEPKAEPSTQLTQQPKAELGVETAVEATKAEAEQGFVRPVVFTDETETATTENDVLTQDTKSAAIEEKPIEKPTDDAKQNEIAFTMVDRPTQMQAPVVVKISDEATKLEPMTQTQIADEVKMHLTEGKSEFTMQLNPEHLGKVSVKLISENGMLTVELHAENPRTHSLLLSSSDEIQALLQNATNTTTQVIASSQSQGMQQNYTQQEEQQEKASQQQQQSKPQQQDSETVDFEAILRELQAKSLFYQTV